MGIYLRRVSAENKIIRGPLWRTQNFRRCHLQMQRNARFVLMQSGSLAPVRNSSLDQVAIVPQSEFMRTKVGRVFLGPIYRFCDGGVARSGQPNT